MFERLGGAEARDAAVRYFEHPNLETREAYQRICLPLYNPGPPDPEAFARVVKHHEVGVHFWTNQLPELDLSAEASRVRCPTLILGGELDPLATPADLEGLAAAIPGSQLTIVPGTGHGLRNKPTFPHGRRFLDQRGQSEYRFALGGRPPRRNSGTLARAAARWIADLPE